MNQDEIIAMARQAGCIPRRHPEYWEDVQVFATPEVLQAFAKLIEQSAAAKEIERIIAENKPEIEKCNAYIKELEEAVLAEREACALIVEANADACRSDGVAQMCLYSNAQAIRARGEA
jgi:wobble nucleotide-excising tRNase